MSWPVRDRWLEPPPERRQTRRHDGHVTAQDVTLDSDMVSGLPIRAIGPAAMGGRIADIAAVREGGRLTIYVGSASGGVAGTEASLTDTPTRPLLRCAVAHRTTARAKVSLHTRSGARRNARTTAAKVRCSIVSGSAA